MAKLYWRVKKQGKWTWKAAKYDVVTGIVTPEVKANQGEK